MAGGWATQALYVAAKLGIADRLRTGARNDAALAAATTTHAPSLYRLLRVLATLGILAELPSHRFRLTDVGKLLCSDHPKKLRNLAILVGEERYKAWGALLGTIRTGQPAFDRVYGRKFYQHFAGTPSKMLFDEFLETTAGSIAAQAAAAYDFSTLGTVVDIGGGEGRFLSVLLKQHPKLRGVLFDTSGVIAKARKNLRVAGLLGRCQVKAGDFFRSVPTGADAYVLLRIIHEFDDKTASEILRNCRLASPQARVLLLQNVLTSSYKADFDKLLDLNMLVVFGGAERTRDQYRELLKSAGYRLTRVLHCPQGTGLIEGSPED